MKNFKTNTDYCQELTALIGDMKQQLNEIISGVEMTRHSIDIMRDQQRIKQEQNIKVSEELEKKRIAIEKIARQQETII